MSTAAMEGSTTFSSNKEEPKDQKKMSQESLIGANWPSLPIPADSQDSQASPSQIQPEQKSPKTTPWKGQQRGHEDYERDRVGKYAKYFAGNEILPIPETVKQLEPRILSLVISDIKPKRLAGLKKESFEELLRKARHPMSILLSQKLCNLDVLLPTKEQAEKAAANNLMTKNSDYSRSTRGPIGSC